MYDRPSSRSQHADVSVTRSDPGWRASVACVLALAVVATLVYSPALHAPWYLDDTPVIVQNPLLRDLWGSLAGIYLPRGIALFSFAVNVHFGGIDPFGYHLVNLGLHIGCGLLVYLLLRGVVREGALIPALGALLFIAHPLQTQAVTYVVQRMTLLAALFFLLALYLFVRSRERLAAGVPFAAAGHLGRYLAAVCAGLCAVATKENTVVLPVVLYLFVAFLLPPLGDRRRLLLSLLPFAVAALASVVLRLLLPLAGGASLSAIAGTTHLTQSLDNAPLHYLVTEFSVLWTYLRMLVLPYGQAFEHNVRIATDLFELRHLLAGTGLVLLGVLAVQLRRRLPPVAVGIAWFFLTLAVESTFIPLDPLYEHRLYLPLFGLVLAVCGGLRLVPERRVAVAVLAVLVVACLPLTWQRNRLWADPVALYRDNLAKTPGNERILTDFALWSESAGQGDAAESLLRQALASNPDYLPALIGLVGVYNNQRRLPEAIATARRGLERYPRSPPLLRALATLYANSGDLQGSLAVLDRVLELDPRRVAARVDRAMVLARLGRLPEAEAEFRNALALDPANPTARNGLALTRRSQGKSGD